MALRHHTHAFRPMVHRPNKHRFARLLSAGCFERAKKQPAPNKINQIPVTEKEAPCALSATPP
ncbi:hypothetical protein [Kingella denitrificans]